MKDSDYLRHLGQLTLSLWTAAWLSGNLSALIPKLARASIFPSKKMKEASAALAAR
jgi:hypothetical protein